ncbi:hypothetical protein [Marinifilum caeruleilacunae]|uniref:YD repeat-containing protein n=1 Tax=Marinifilum caeruleilacunae TaxID=2499076 RepID=A0ABX1X0U5_9BACT|nr:hypothetical protein [Marinifilum caeruleilacunae]NOU61987.1 hypothetical protein [Marinifilum caeruleilacunae]
MRTAIYILINLVPCLLFAQDYPIIDTLNYGGNVSHVKYYFQNDGDKEILLETYWFNESRKHTITYTGYDGIEIYKQTKTSYNYDINNNLTTVKYLDYISPKNDSIGKLLISEIRKAYKEDKNISNELIEKYQAMYEYINPENINWGSNKEMIPLLIFKRNRIGNDSLIEIYNEINDKEIYLDQIVFFFYDKQNRIKRKKWIDIPNSNVFKFQVFKPSDVKLEDSIKVLTNSYQEKTFKYYKDSIVMKHYVNGRFTGSEINKTNSNGTLSEFVLNSNGDTLSSYLNEWDLRKNLINRKRIKHTGYDGFGYSLDLTFGNIKKYKYDEKNRLIQIDTFEDDKHVCTERFEIVEK